MPQTFAIILSLNSFKILLLFPQPFATILTLYSTNEVKNIVNACYIVNIQHSLAGKRQQRLYVRYLKPLAYEGNL